MSTLPDVNVLVALAFPNHIHHARAHSWFSSSTRGAWATCAATQAGFVRVSSNPKAIPEARTPREALSLLRLVVALDGHEFWADAVSPASDEHGVFARVFGYRQTTDAHLLALAMEHGGRVGSFDRGLLDLVPDDRRRGGLVLPIP